MAAGRGYSAPGDIVHQPCIFASGGRGAVVPASLDLRGWVRSDEALRMVWACLTTVGLGFVYFVATIPAGMAMGLPWPLAAFCGWAGYSLGSVVVVVLGEPLRRWLARRFHFLPDRSRHAAFWKVWDRYGLPGMGLLAPVTIGPQGSTLVGLALGVPPRRLCLAVSLGVVPWCIGIGLVSAAGFRLVE